MSVFEWMPRQGTDRLSERILAAQHPGVAVSRAHAVWARSEAVYRGPVGYGATRTLPWALLEDLLARWRSGAIPALRCGLGDASDVVVAYCIVGLGYLGEPLDPAQFSHRHRKLRWCLGSFAGRATLSEFADFCCT